MAYAAAATTKLRVASLVTILPLHHPVRLAQMITSLDHLSGGRVILGVGAGGEYPKQFDAFGVPLSQRGTRTNEYLEILIGLWTEATFSHNGRYFQFSDISQEPLPLQKPHPPIWIGGRPGGVQTASDGTTQYKSKTAAAARAGRYGQAWIPYYVTTEQVKTTVDVVRASALEAGRDPDRILIGLNNQWLVKDSFGAALAVAQQGERYGRDISSRVSQYDLLGSPTDVIGRMESYIEAGVSHFQCGWQCPPNEVSAQMEVAAKHILPYFRPPARRRRHTSSPQARPD